MAKFVFTGTDQYTKQLEKLAAKDDGVLKYAVYPGAAVVADAIRAEIEANHSDSGDLAKALTLSTMRNDKGYVNTKIMFPGYDRKGVPNQVKANVLESGHSGSGGTHFLSKTVNRVKEKAIRAMSEALDKKIKELTEE